MYVDTVATCIRVLGKREKEEEQGRSQIRCSITPSFVSSQLTHKDTVSLHSIVVVVVPISLFFSLSSLPLIPID